MLLFDKKKAWLAPLAGYSDVFFRSICRTYGAAGAFTEMVSTKGIMYGGANTVELLQRGNNDDPLVVQIFSSDVESTIIAMEYLIAQGFQYFDLNVGCSVRKVVKTGCGAQLLRSPAILASVVRAMVSKAPVGHVGCKIRLGYEYGDAAYKTIVPLLEDCGIGWLSVHGRYAKQGYAGTADWRAIAEIVQISTVPVLASGDMFSAEQAKRCLEITGAAAVLFARGALHKPYIFEQFTAYMEGKTYEEPLLSTVIEQHTRIIEQHMPQRRGIAKLRGIVSRYCKGYRCSGIVREKLNAVQEYGQLYAIIDMLKEYESSVL